MFPLGVLNTNRGDPLAGFGHNRGSPSRKSRVANGDSGRQSWKAGQRGRSTRSRVDYIVLPPSTSSATPVRNTASAEDRDSAGLHAAEDLLDK